MAVVGCVEDFLFINVSLVDFMTIASATSKSIFLILLERLTRTQNVILDDSR